MSKLTYEDKIDIYNKRKKGFTTSNTREYWNYP